MNSLSHDPIVRATCGLIFCISIAAYSIRVGLDKLTEQVKRFADGITEEVSK